MKNTIYGLLLSLLIILPTQAQRQPECIIEQEEIQEFKQKIDSILVLYQKDNDFRRPILEIGHNSFIDSLIEYNLQEFAYYVNNYWYELDSKNEFLIENTAPQEGYMLFRDNKEVGFHRQYAVCDCGKRHVYGHKRKDSKKYKNNNEHIIYHNWFWHSHKIDSKRWNRQVSKARKRNTRYHAVQDRNASYYFLDAINYGISEKRILEGNIGYLKWQTLPAILFFNEEKLEDLVREFLFTSALIIDLRASKSMPLNHVFYQQEKKLNELSFATCFVERFLHPDSTYFLGKASLQRTRKYVNAKGKIKNEISNPTIELVATTEAYKPFIQNRVKWAQLYWWNYQNIDEEAYKKRYTLRYHEQPIYILVDRHTSDVAELIAHSLQKYRKAIIIGEPTANASAITRSSPLTQYSWINTPDIKFGSSYQVNPDIFISKYDTTSTDRIFDVAYKIAFQKEILDNKFSTIRKYGDRHLEWKNLHKSIPASYVIPTHVEDFLGKYELGKEIIIQDGKLWFKNYYEVRPIYQSTTPNKFVIEPIINQRLDNKIVPSIAKPAYLFFKKNVDEQTQDSIMTMFIRYDDYTSAAFNQVKAYTIAQFAPKSILIDTTAILRPNEQYPFAQMTYAEKEILFKGLTLQRSLPNLEFTTLSEQVNNTKNSPLSVWVFWSPSSSVSLEMIKEWNTVVENFSQKDMLFYGFTTEKNKELQDFLVGTPIYADIVPAAQELYEKLFIPTQNIILVKSADDKWIFHSILKDKEDIKPAFEKLSYFLNNQVLND